MKNFSRFFRRRVRQPKVVDQEVFARLYPRDTFRLVEETQGYCAYIIVTEPTVFVTREDAIRSLLNEPEKWSGDVDRVIDAIITKRLRWNDGSCI